MLNISTVNQNVQVVDITKIKIVLMWMKILYQKLLSIFILKNYCGNSIFPYQTQYILKANHWVVFLNTLYLQARIFSYI